jgi:hypothetical protein
LEAHLVTTEERLAGEIVLAGISPFIVGIVAKDDLGLPGRMLGTGTVVELEALGSY